MLEGLINRGSNVWDHAGQRGEARRMEKDKLAARAAKGDEAAFTALMDSERHRLYRIASAYLGNEADALEAIQEAVCRALAEAP